MARLPRLGVAAWPHLLVQQVHDGQSLARDDIDRQALGEALREAARAHGVVVHAYHLGESSLMLVATPESADGLSLMMQALGRRYVAGFNRRHGRQGGLWAGRYRGTVLDPARYVLDAMVLVETREAAPHAGAAVFGSAWSSAGHHLGLRTDPLVTDPAIFWALGNTPFERQAAWRLRLAEGLSQARTAELVQAMHKGWALMSPEQEAALSQSIGRRLSPRPRGRPRKAPAIPPSAPSS
ncbi:MAG: transposase [Proteobacteria bacterium]|uniref:transposase n=1 Tax=Aquabacterium sp. TaxID=1872578 RepID=UPI0035C76544|nr:transposase [Pseudomonadota bacterium]